MGYSDWSIFQRTDGIAISELLMENYRDSQKYSPLVSKEDAKLTNNIPSPSEAEIIEKYTDLLLLGNKNDALGIEEMKIIFFNLAIFFYCFL